MPASGSIYINRPGDVGKEGNTGGEMEAFEKSCANCGRYRCDHPDGDWPDFCMTTNSPQAFFDEALDEYRNDPMTRRIF
jgi:hypothetical protein